MIIQCLIKDYIELKKVTNGKKLWDEIPLKSKWTTIVTLIILIVFCMLFVGNKIGNSCFLGIQIIIYLIVVFNFHRILSKNTLIKQNYIKSGKIRIIGLKSLLEHYNINRFDINQMNKLYRELEKYRDQHNALAKFKSLIKLVNPIGQIGAAFLGALIKNINETNLFIHFFCVALSAYTVLLALYLIIASLIETFGMNEYYNCDNLIEDLTQIELFDNRKY